MTAQESINMYTRIHSYIPSDCVIEKLSLSFIVFEVLDFLCYLFVVNIALMQLLIRLFHR